MSTIALWISKAILALAVASAGMVLPIQTHANAAGQSENTLASTPDPSHDRLERAWEREQRVYARLGRIFDKADERIAGAQTLIDKAKSNGKDVSALQVALDAFAAAMKSARPIYEGGKGILASHKGFDADGNVVDAEQARQTVLEMHTKLGDTRETLAGPAKALRDAIRAFRQANRPAVTPTPSAGGG